MILHQRLEHVLFLHWPVAPDALPVPAELDTFDGRAWLSLVGLRLARVRPRFLPPLATVAQLNVRTYLEGGGVTFLRIDGNRRLAAWVSRRLFRLPYHHARVELGPGRFRCVRRDGAELAVAYEPSGEPAPARAGTLDHWLTERYWSVQADGRRATIEHAPWPLQAVTVRVERNTVLPPGLPAGPARSHYAAAMPSVVRG